MKFVCNNCGFTAEIPVRRTTCPMCGSSNVSSSAETMTPPEKPLEDEDKKEEIKTRNARSGEGPTQRVTITEGLTTAKQDKACCKKSCRCKILIPVAVILVLLLAALAAFFFLK